MIAKTAATTTRTSWRTVLFVALGAVLVLTALMAASTFLGSGSTRAYLRSPVPGNRIQMFANPGSGADAFADFPQGTVCDKLDGPIHVDFGDGMASNYYRLTCQGVTGYVNVKWVSRD